MRRVSFVIGAGIAVAVAMGCQAPFSFGSGDPTDDLQTIASMDDAGDGGDAGDAAATEACPAGLGSRWTCDGTRRTRCVDDHLVAEECAPSCTMGADGEAVCSCGEMSNFTRWTCTPVGRATCAGRSGWVVDSCAGKECSPSATGLSDACKNDGPIQKIVDELGTSCSKYAPGVKCSIAVRDLTTNERAGFADTVPFVSASAAKAFWVAAGLFDKGIAPVEPFVKAIFEQSDNIATGNVLDLLSSPERVNTFLWQNAEVADIGFCAWNYGGTRNAKNCPHVMGDDNFFTTSEAVRFLSSIWDRSLLGTEKSAKLLSWMTMSPRNGYGGWLGTQLPATAQKTMHHKAGWRPPSAIPGYSNANDIGIVEIPGGHTYAVAFALSGAPSQAAYDDQELPLLEYLSCGVYHAVAGDDPSGCKHR